MQQNITTSNLADFEAYVKSIKPVIKRQYDRNVNRDLSQHNWHDLFRRNVVDVLKQAYEEALTYLQQVSSNLPKAQKKQEGSKLSKQALHYLNELGDEIMQYALQKHRGSCALSNFPDEHNPAKEYIATVIEELEREWEYFVFQVHAVLEH